MHNIDFPATVYSVQGEHALSSFSTSPPPPHFNLHSQTVRPVPVSTTRCIYSPSWPFQLVMEGIRSIISAFIFSFRDLRACSFSSSRLDSPLFRVRIRWCETVAHDTLVHLLAFSSSQARHSLRETAIDLTRVDSFVFV